MIDRIAPTRRPEGRPIGFQSWRQLLFLHWPVPAEVLRPVVPNRLSVDVYEGTAWVSLVAFAMVNVRRAGTPRLLWLNFLETNLRTYVHLDGRDPGVYFFSLDASSRIAVAVARRQVGLPYFLARMRLVNLGQAVEYETHRRSGTMPRLTVRCEPGEYLGPSSPGTLEHFLLERYLLYVERKNSLWTLQVHHPPYPAQRARVLDLEDELLAAAGLARPTEQPRAHYAAGVDVEIFPPRPALARWELPATGDHL